MIGYGRQHIDPADIRAVTKVLKSNLITQGLQINKFENALKSKFGAKYCTVVSSGTAALHLTAKALGWKKGDIVLTTPMSFLATANCILYSGAIPVFVDIKKSTYNIDENKLVEKIINLKSKAKKVVAIIATDYAGNPNDWTILQSIAKKYNLCLINDNCHALGASFKNNSKYAIKYADIVTQSFHPVKHITTGEGGAVFTKDKNIDKKIRRLRTHGIVNDPKFMKSNHGPWYYEMHELGYNYRITDFQCSLGASQLKKLNKFVKRRREIAKIYDKELSNKNIFITPKTSINCRHAYHLYPLQIDFNKIKITKKKLFEKFKKHGIQLQVHYIPIHLQPFYKKKFGFKRGDFPVAENFYEKEVSLPIYYSLKNSQVYKIIRLLKKI
jgi:UDP-4-amino-4,6-dideoxy-N-acetyl-beta-L-altrosamine transaminase